MLVLECLTLLLKVVVRDRLLGGDPKSDVVLPVTAHEDLLGQRGVLLLQLGTPQALF